MGIVWKRAKHPVILRIILPTELSKNSKTPKTGECYDRNPSPFIVILSKNIIEFLNGKAIIIDLHHFHLAQCTPFQRKVLAAEFNIPRGFVSTYGNIAAYLGIPGAARAVGNALGTNPFPIVIPCHRTVRDDGSIGGYRSGITMKRALLEMEGITFSTSGRVCMDNVFYTREQ